jgi:hypothetical protein
MNFEISPYSHGSAMEPWKAPGKVYSQTVLVDSRDRDTSLYPNPNSYRVLLPAALRNVTSARLVSAEIPGMFYVFNAARGNTSLRVSLANPVESHTVTIPDGNYSAFSMADALRTALDDAFTETTFEVSLNQSTMRYTITNTDDRPITIRCSDGSPGVGDAPFTWGLGYYLGFEKTDLFGSSGTVTAPGVLNLRPESYMLLRIRGLDTVYQTGGIERKSFAKIPFTVSSFGINFFDKLLTDNIMNPVRERLEWLDIDLTFYDDSHVEFVGAGEHSLTLEFFCNQTTI